MDAVSARKVCSERDLSMFDRKLNSSRSRFAKKMNHRGVEWAIINSNTMFLWLKMIRILKNTDVSVPCSNTSGNLRLAS